MPVYKVDKLPADEIIRLYTEDMQPLSAIAAIYDVSDLTISKVLEINGIKRRSPNEAASKRHENKKLKTEPKPDFLLTPPTKLNEAEPDIEIPPGSFEERVLFLRKEKQLYIQDIAYLLGVETSKIYLCLQKLDKERENGTKATPTRND